MNNLLLIKVMPKWDKERLAVLESTSQQNMIDHQEIKDSIKGLITKIDWLGNQIMTGLEKQDDKIQRQEEKFIMRREAWAVSWVIGFLVLVLWIILNIFKL